VDFSHRKRGVYAAIFLFALSLGGWKVMGVFELIPFGPFSERFFWVFLVLLQAVIFGAVFQPLTKNKFPKGNDPDVVKEPKLFLKDYETMAGYYPIVALLGLLGGILLWPFFSTSSVFEIHSAHFWWAAIGTGILNTFLFYFLTKAFRYGDLSLVSATWAVSPLFVLPISFLIFELIGDATPLTNPSVSTFGFLGIMLTVGAVLVNVFVERHSGPVSGAPAGDWFANHPVLSGLFGMLFATVALNFDKVAADSANPFLSIFIAMSVVSFLTISMTVLLGSWGRLFYIIKRYWRSFLIVGGVYGITVLLAYVTLFGENVNYQGALKRSSAIFGTLYGIYVLGEGINGKAKMSRILVALSVVAGVLLIAIWG